MYLPGTDLGGMRADLGELPLGAVDANGVAWFLQGMRGWDSPELRAELQQREGDHGAWHTPGYLAERPVTLTGTIVAPDRAALEDAMDRARAAAGLDDVLLVVREHIPRQAVVRRSGSPVMEYTTDRIATYSLMVTAADPRRYATEEQSDSTPLASSTGGLTLPAAPPLTLAATTVSGEVAAYNAGDLGTRPVLRIDGPVAAPRIYAQYENAAVRALLYAETLGAGDSLVVDVDAKSVILNGSASRRRFLTAQWPEIPPRQTVRFLFTADVYAPGALLTVTWRSAWM